MVTMFQCVFYPHAGAAATWTMVRTPSVHPNTHCPSPPVFGADFRVINRIFGANVTLQRLNFIEPHKQSKNAALSRLGMGLGIDLDKAPDIDMGVDLGCGDGSVSQEFLDRGQIRPGGKQMGGE